MLLFLHEVTFDYRFIVHKWKVFLNWILQCDNRIHPDGIFIDSLYVFTRHNLKEKLNIQRHFCPLAENLFYAYGNTMPDIQHMRMDCVQVFMMHSIVVCNIKYCVKSMQTCVIPTLFMLPWNWNCITDDDLKKYGTWCLEHKRSHTRN